MGPLSIGLGLIDFTFFVLIHEAYKTWTKLQRPNVTDELNIRLWALLGCAGFLGGLLAPIIYIWACYNGGSITEIHIFRTSISLLLSLIMGFYIFKDSINGLRIFGLLLSVIGFALVMFSSEYKF